VDDIGRQLASSTNMSSPFSQQNLTKEMLNRRVCWGVRATDEIRLRKYGKGDFTISPDALSPCRAVLQPQPGMCPCIAVHRERTTQKVTSGARFPHDMTRMFIGNVDCIIAVLGIINQPDIFLWEVIYT
jgi:hypothetical protein